MSIKLQEPITGGGLQNTNFFNGRLVTGADMTREQTSRRQAVNRLGQAVGEGIAEGLMVEMIPNAKNDPVVGISAGRAVNCCGQVLSLSEDTTVNLLQRLGTVDQKSDVFADCRPLTVGTYAAGFGLYLLVLSPVLTKQGSAPTGGLKNSVAACSSDVVLEAVQFRLLSVDYFLAHDVLPDSQMLRNYIAYRCFGTKETQTLFQNPFQFEKKSYGLIDEMRGKTLSDSDVPLAIISWTAGGLEFVEMWAVRRRLTRQAGEDWTQLLDDRRMSETEAMIKQFAEQIKDSNPDKNDYRDVAAADYFEYLPPVGMLPLATSIAQFGFDLEVFFGGRQLKNVAMFDGEKLRPLLREALSHEPINLNGDEKIQLYLIRENFTALQANQVKQITVVFAKRSLPYFGTARFDFAQWNLSRFV
jgi:hypothetical protein